jgi:hypothetical protein
MPHNFQDGQTPKEFLSVCWRKEKQKGRRGEEERRKVRRRKEGVHLVFV